MIDHRLIRHWISDFSVRVDNGADELNRLDAALGDGDYGASMQRGLLATSSALNGLDGDSVGQVLQVTGSTIVSTIGGTSGPLVGTLFLKAGLTLGDSTHCTLGEFAAALRTGAIGVMDLGGAALGDKTMLDALLPALDALEEEIAAEAPFVQATASVAQVAARAASETSELAARRGRASYTGTGGRGHVDPGAQGMALLFESLHAAANDAEIS